MITNQFRANFPFFTQSEWTYLDSAATTLKPQILIDETADFYRSAGSVHRSQYDHSQSEHYEQARNLIAQRFNLENRQAVIWTSGTTHSINIIANGLAYQLQAGDEIIISVAEHHANFIPWQQLAQRTGAKLIVLPVNNKYQIDTNTLHHALSSRTKLVAFNLVSNVTGVRQPMEQLVPIIRQYSNAKILLDIAQAVCTEKVDTQTLDADFYAFSAHKMYGPTGVGVLMGKLQSLSQIQPLTFGGKMLKDINAEQLTLAELPYRLEAGTPNIAGIIGFGRVLEWLNQWDFSALNQSLYTLAEATRKRLVNYPNLKIIGSTHNSPTISFIFNQLHHADISAILTEQKIALRVGEHCAKPYLRYLQQSGTIRLSLAHYNNEQDIDRFFNRLDIALSFFEDEI
ncbi:cysteine desulfurase [Vespertiliibacter pulmonis]|uniref:cysteine desulfurase n=1 Tax=Vespertiliibacter pulmonis TaxID=1443036 RepID=A0A3N4WCN3_9PAST|nr:cysteine desulfurase [Vespertiliibacter pulmonis]QLB21100.1 cysteine desulfurase [Vespertiliibacter pulmonis]RPE83800.1 cysteine sulfinate desulfinase [Vespertiliibacter pulmonis]